MYISESDKSLIRQLIEQQLQAFKANDSETAFALTSPKIQSSCTPHNFIQELSAEYSAIVHSRSIVFQDFTLVKNFPALVSMVMDQEGKLKKAIFVVQHQQDYTWRVHGYELAGINEKIV
ncbi:MAG: DUF4864 domain-containing protein [Cyanobacteria bacterium J06600_6]